MKKKFTYQSTKRILLMLLVLGIVLVVLADRVGAPGDTLRTVFIWGGSLIFLAVLVIMFIGFRCPACGAHFFKNAFFLHSCPVCGFKFDDFELGKKMPLPKDWKPNPNDSGEVLNKHDD